MKRKYHYLILGVLSLIILVVLFNIVRNNSPKKTINNQLAEEINLSSLNTKDIIFKENGVYLQYLDNHNLDKPKEMYFILNGSIVNLEGEAPFYSNVDIKTSENEIQIYFDEEIKKYPQGKYPDHKLIFKITPDKKYEYIKVFKNGQESHFDSVGA